MCHAARSSIPSVYPRQEVDAITILPFRVTEARPALWLSTRKETRRGNHADAAHLVLPSAKLMSGVQTSSPGMPHILWQKAPDRDMKNTITSPSPFALVMVLVDPDHPLAPKTGGRGDASVIPE